MDRPFRFDFVIVENLPSNKKLNAQKDCHTFLSLPLHCRRRRPPPWYPILLGLATTFPIKSRNMCSAFPPATVGRTRFAFGAAVANSHSHIPYLRCNIVLLPAIVASASKFQVSERIEEKNRSRFIPRSILWAASLLFPCFHGVSQLSSVQFSSVQMVKKRMEKVRPVVVAATGGLQGGFPSFFSCLGFLFLD